MPQWFEDKFDDRRNRDYKGKFTATHKFTKQKKLADGKDHMGQQIIFISYRY